MYLNCITFEHYNLCTFHYSLLWVPAPPKLSLHPSTVQTHLFPDYHSSTKPWTSSQQPGPGRGGAMRGGDNTGDGYQRKYTTMCSDVHVCV